MGIWAKAWGRGYGKGTISKMVNEAMLKATVKHATSVGAGVTVTDLGGATEYRIDHDLPVGHVGYQKA